jgi:dTDP-4-dehydrorhamnose reductase
VIATARGKSQLPFPGSQFQYLEMDITDHVKVHELIKKERPTHIIHAAAISSADDCEKNPALASKINVEATTVLLDAAEKINATFTFLSTDFVFDGAKGMYTETDEPSPVNYYGYTKMMAEKEIIDHRCKWSIIRTILVYGQPFFPRRHLLGLVKEKLERGETYQMVSDQVRTPTYVEDLANGIVTIIGKGKTGIYHLGGPEKLSPFEMAMRAAEYLRLDTSLLTSVTAEIFKEPAKRPPITGLSIDKAFREFGYSPLNFSEGLKKTFGAQIPK